MAVKLKRRKRRPGSDARKRMERSEVLIKKLGQAITSIRIFSICMAVIFSLGTCGFAMQTPILLLGLMLAAVGNVLFCELLLIRNLKKYKEWARVLSVVYLIFASLITPLILPLVLAAFVAVTTVPGLFGLLDSRTKRVLAEERERDANKATAPPISRCAECGKPVGGDALEFGDKRVCPVCKDQYVQRVKEGVA